MRRRQETAGPSATRYPIMMGLIGMFLSATLFTSACGSGATAENDQSSNASSSASSKSGTSSASASGSSSTASASQGNLPQGGETVKLDPADFTTNIDNPYWPMSPGDKWIYRETDEGSKMRVEVTVTDKTRKIANGVEARVVHDVVTEDGQPVEVTDDYYAQDKDGTIWYMGEDTAEYENGKVTTREGSFEAGKDGAQAGVIMPANPRDGMIFRQEYLKGEAEDEGEILSTNEQVQAPFGYYKGALLTRDTTPLEPKVTEYKLYAKDVGPVLVVQTSGGSGREELTDFTHGG
ncbi:hypothetical protein BH18ACT10_BH18ACT10_00220 [soil metagenome]